MAWEGIEPSVFSTSVEVFLSSAAFLALVIGLLHVRGGVSKSTSLLHREKGVFSTSVEVFP